jgi:hypothetical protein
MMKKAVPVADVATGGTSWEPFSSARKQRVWACADPANPSATTAKVIRVLVKRETSDMIYS